ncbi:MAG: DNA internalization-related competence protein ComEC/Rec2 [Chloroflexi bacterium]|nr:DNA internalization-related competence protein ComEC/Rec2 [Chloroflexota bacterium]
MTTPLAILSVAWVAGVAAGVVWGVPWTALALFLVAALCLALIARLNRWPLLLPLAAAVLLLGVTRGSGASEPPDSLRPWVGAGVVKLEGVVAGDPEPLGTALRFRFQGRRLWDGDEWREVKGDLLVNVTPPKELVQARGEPYLRYGDALTLEGALVQAPTLEGFDYREYLARRGIQAIMGRPALTLESEGHGWPHYALAYRVRRALAGSLARALPEPQASLAQAILMGLRVNMPERMEQAFLDTGTTHLLAVSGMNVGMALAMALPLSIALLGRRRNLYLLLPLALLWAYAFVSGLSPSVVRAALMASVYLAALGLGRPHAPLAAMGLAAALMVAHRPNLLYDLSFQLSFVSLAGILALWRPLADVLEKALGRPLRTDRWPGWLRTWLVEGAAVSVAAVVASWPILAFTFQRMSLLSAPATVLVLPVLPVIMATAFVASLAGLAAPLAGQLAAWAAWLPLSYLTWVVETMARLPVGVLHVGWASPLLVWGYYGAIAAAMFAAGAGRERLKEWLQREAPPVTRGRGDLPLPETIGLLTLAVVATVAWAAASTLPDGKLHVTFLDVGQGDAVLVQTPEGHQVLVDGGPSPRILASKLGERMPFWDRSLEVVALSHYHEDHLAGLLEALRRYKVALVLDNPFRQEGSNAAQWGALAASEEATLVVAQAAQELRLGGDVTLGALGPPTPLMGGTESDINNNSTVLRLRYRDFSLLLPGDLAQEGEALLLSPPAAGLGSSVLKVGHHGSATSTSGPFLAAVRPLLAVVSVGEGNPYGHPTAEAMGRLHAAAGEGGVLTTAERGDIELVTDGHTVWVKMER